MAVMKNRVLLTGIRYGVGGVNVLLPPMPIEWKNQIAKISLFLYLFTRDVWQS